MIKEKDFPILKGFYSGSIQIKVWCPFCQVWHFHGATENFTKTKGEGHRDAYCTNENSPFKKTGYIIKVITRKEIKGCDVKGELKERERNKWKARILE